MPKIPRNILNNYHRFDKFKQALLKPNGLDVN